MKSYNNFFDLYIVNGTSDVYNTTAGLTTSVITSGLIGFFDESNLTVKWNNSNLRFEDVSGNKVSVVRPIVNQAGTLVYGTFFNHDNVINKTTKAYSASTLQTDYIGFEGSASSTNSIDDQVNTLYNVVISKLSYTSQTSEFPLYSYGTYESEATTSQPAIASGIAKSLNAQSDNQKSVYQWTKSEVLVNNAGAALGTSVDTLTFTNGSKYFTADDIDNGTGGAPLAAGDYIRVSDKNDMEVTLTGTSGTASVVVGGLTNIATFDTNLTTTASNFVTTNKAAYLAIGIVLTSAAAVLTFVKTDGTAISAGVGTVTNAAGDLAGTAIFDTNLTDPCYLITALDIINNIGTLNMPYQGVSFSAEDTSFKRIVAGTALTAGAGIKISAVEATPAATFDPARQEFEVPTYNVGLGNVENWGDTVLTLNSTISSRGIGDVREISKIEFENLPARNNVAIYTDVPVSFTTYVDKTLVGYDIFELKYYNNDKNTKLKTSTSEYGSLIIAINQAVTTTTLSQIFA